MADRDTTTADTVPPVTWRYVIEAEDGRQLRGDVIGRTEAEALLKVKALGGTPLELKQAAPGRGLFSQARTRLVPSEVLDLTRGTAELIDAGIPLRDALSALAQRERRPALRGVLVRLEDRLRSGESFSRALEEDPAGLPKILVALARAGESSGLLAKNLTGLAAQMEDEEALRQELVSQMIYPLALVILIGLTLVFLSYFVLPQFETIFADARAEPPPVTQFVFGVGAFLRTYAVWLPPIVIGLAILARILIRQSLAALDSVFQRLPVLGPTLRALDAARFCATLGLLLSSGQPLTRAEVIARTAVASPGLRARYAIAAESVREGASLSVALARQNVLPEQAQRFVELGEKTGRLDAMLARAAAFHEREVRTLLKASVALIGPAMIAILGLCVGGVIAAVMVGVLSLNDVVY